MIREVDSGLQSVPILVAQQIVQRTLPALERRVDEVIVSKPPVVDFMVSNVQIVDSIGLNWLLSIQGRLDTLGIRMRLIDPSPIFSDILLATRLDSRFTIEVTASLAASNGNGIIGGSNGR
jgi:anti-anti-sigma regulatory factor